MVSFGADLTGNNGWTYSAKGRLQKYKTGNIGSLSLQAAYRFLRKMGRYAVFGTAYRLSLDGLLAGIGRYEKRQNAESCADKTDNQHNRVRGQRRFRQSAADTHKLNKS